jgi:hypothetical protein
METVLKSIGLPAGAVLLITWMWGNGWALQTGLVLWACAATSVYFFQIYAPLGFFKDRYGELEKLAATPPSEPSAWLKQEVATYFREGGQPRAWYDQVQLQSDRVFGAKIWSYTAFDRLLLFAVVYPVIWMELVWVLTGTGQVGSLMLLPQWAKEPLWQRLAFALLLNAPMLLPLLLMRTKMRVLAVAVAIGATAYLAGALAFSASGESGMWIVFVFTIASAFAVLGSFVGAGASTYIVGFAGDGAIAFAGAYAIAVGVWAVAIAIGLGCVRLEHKNRSVLVVFVSGGLVALLLAAVALLTPRFVGSGVVFAAGPSFVNLVFLGVFPLVNGLFDWVSVAFTRQVLAWYVKPTFHGWLWSLLVLDLLVAALLTVLLYAIVLALLVGLERLGWGVDAKALVLQFRNNPYDPQVSWIAMMAITNLLPTLVHSLTWAWLSVMRPRFLSEKTLGRSMQLLRDKLPSLQTSQSHDLILGVDGKPLASPKTPKGAVGAVDLRHVFHYLMFERWLILFGVVAVIVAFWNPYLTVLGRLLNWFPFV